MKKVTILFDLDGTLIDSTEAILDGFYYTFKRFGQNPPPKEKILALIGHPLDFMFAHLGIKEEDIEKYVQSYKERYRIVSKQKTILLPRAKEAIEEAVQFANLGIVTTKTGLYSKELMEHFGLMHYFGVLIGREDVIHPKPHPEPIFKAMHKLHAHPEHSWMVGDTCLDIEAANAAGIGSVAVECGYATSIQLRRCARHRAVDAYKAVAMIRHKELE